MIKSDKIAIIFYACLGISLIITYSYFDSLYERPQIDLHLPLEPHKTISFSNIITTRTHEQMYDVITDIENYPLVLPKNILSVKILNKTDDFIIAEEELYENFIKTKLTVKHSFTPMKKHIIEILDGDAKGTVITQSFIGLPDGLEIKTDVDLNLKGVLYPVSFLPKIALKHAIDTIMIEFSSYAKTKYLFSENKNIVDIMYREILLRPADPEGMKFYVKMLENEKMTVEQIRESLLSSNEYNSLSTQTELKSINELSSTSKKIINDLYMEILGRQADEIGLIYYATQLENDVLSIEDIKQELLNSEEFIQLNLTKQK
ncbi:MAG: hypothetical protein CXT78_00480 [Thaumarchaeota archaeon]|jgi:ribosome-associated toxin RatA of RatAB toxin-antitoxin module|nr:MAG: hypothetical protein CXT78_00480 [Nitrososphaerota archaeon]